jgi:ribonuclease T2
MRSRDAGQPLRRLRFALSLFGASTLGFCTVLSSACDAQDSGCILDNCADKKPLPPPQTNPSSPPASQPDVPAPQAPATNTDNAGTSGGWMPSAPQPSGASSPGDFDFYVLSLSWSPGFCDLGGSEKAPDQCHDGANLGFVVHGLWPQYDHGFPSDCGGATPSWIALQSTQGLYPDVGLARYEWRKHGTCSGKSPTAYFADVRRARDMIAIPPAFQNQQTEQDIAPLDIQRAFFTANPRLRPGMMSVECVNGELSEVRFCLSKDVRNFVPCPEVARQSCRAQDIAVAPMR